MTHHPEHDRFAPREEPAQASQRSEQQHQAPQQGAPGQTPPPGAQGQTPPPGQGAPGQVGRPQQQAAPGHAGPATPPGHAGPATPPGQPGAAPDAATRRPSRGRAESDEARAARERLGALRAEVGKAVVGQEGAVTGLLIALVAGGHVLLEGVPGVAKTLLVRTLSTALDLGTKRVQFTPDLMPGDITGSLIYDAHAAEFEFRPGPVFTNLMLADEINRTPPKTQSALLEAMEERQVTTDGEARPLPDPFMVIATQNPVEHEGTYPLPEAQLDRFLLKLVLDLPARDEEIEVLRRHAGAFDPRNLAGAGVRPVAGPADLAVARREVAHVEVAPEVLGYVVDLVRATRTSPSLSLGVSPRGATALLATARGWAWLTGRTFVTPDDVKALAVPTLRHRVSLHAEAELEGVTTVGVLQGLLSTVQVPR